MAARLSPARRKELERRILAGETKKACVIAGFSPNTVYLARQRLGKSPRHRLPEHLREAARKLRIEQNLSTPRIARQLGISNFSAYCFLRDLPWQRPPKYQATWTDDEIAKLKALWPLAGEDMIREALPGHTWAAIGKEAHTLGIKRLAARLYDESLPRVIKELRAERERQGLTRIDLARRLDLHSQFISNWELGKGHPRWKNLLKWCEALGLELTATRKNV